jgi:hypothetical protein
LCGARRPGAAVPAGVLRRSPTMIVASSRYVATAQRHCVQRASDGGAEGQSSVA